MMWSFALLKYVAVTRVCVTCVLASDPRPTHLWWFYTWLFWDFYDDSVFWCSRRGCRRTRWSRLWTRRLCGVRASASTLKMNSKPASAPSPPSPVRLFYMFLTIYWNDLWIRTSQCLYCCFRVFFFNVFEHASILSSFLLVTDDIRDTFHWLKSPKRKRMVALFFFSFSAQDSPENYITTLMYEVSRHEPCSELIL